MMTPASTKITVLASHPMICHTAWLLCSTSRDSANLPLRAMKTPKTTTASTPLTCSAVSPTKNTVKTLTSTVEISTYTSLYTRFTKVNMTRAQARPKAGPPTASCRNVTMTPPAVTGSASCPASVAASKPTMSLKIRKSTKAEPSFSRLSPSIMVLSLCGAPSVCSTATTATGSVADRMEPSSSALGHDQSYDDITSWMQHAVRPTASTTPGPARSTDWPTTRVKTWKSMAEADSYSSGGRNTNRMTCGCSASHDVSESPSVPIVCVPAHIAHRKPQMKSSTVYGG
mmetsp:Transcript_27665/g.95696  ORF Transcript_27665/g.95696 Transcript_27665/m.95696 type:complete len:286 (-) Transcript_27665:315-1172(-)